MPTWRRTKLKSGTYDQIVTARLERQPAVLGPPIEAPTVAFSARSLGTSLQSGSPTCERRSWDA